MCLEIKIKNKWLPDFLIRPKKLTARKDIICYKIYTTLDDKNVQSVHRHTKHKLGIQPEVKFTYEIYRNRISIYKGYHSFIDIPSNSIISHNHIYKCIIPKGSKYMVGGINNIKLKDGFVSNRIIIDKKLTKDEVLKLRRKL